MYRNDNIIGEIDCMIAFQHFLGEGGREGGGLGGKKMRFDLLFQEKKSLPRYLYGYSVQNLPRKIT